MTTGEGGIVTSNDPDLARRMFLHINKAWGYGDSNPDHYFLALNYRMSELQAAVALAQLEKLDDCVETRIRNANRLSELVNDIDGIGTPGHRRRRSACLLEILPDDRRFKDQGWRCRHGCYSQGEEHIHRSEIHPETVIYVSGIPREEHVWRKRFSVQSGKT